MFDVSFWELVVIGVVALVVIGPEKLPDVARTVGRWIGRTRRFVNQVKADIDREVRMEEIKKALDRNADLNELKQIMNTEVFTLEEEKPKQEYQVKAQSDQPASTTTNPAVTPANTATPSATAPTNNDVKHSG